MMRARFGLALALLSASGLARADVSTPSAAPDTVLPVHTLSGPFASIEAYCAKLRAEEDGPADCTVARRSGHTAALVLRWGGHQRDVELALEDGAGWWIDADPGVRHPLLYDGDRGRGGFIIESVSDRPGSAQLRGVQGHWWKPLDPETDRSDHDIYYCFAMEVRCWSRPGGPVCSEPLPVAGRHDCGLGDEGGTTDFVAGRWDWKQPIRDGGDGRDVAFARRSGRSLPTKTEGYNEWFEDVLALTRSLAGTHRHIEVRPADAKTP